MLVPYSWLKEFVNLKKSAEAIAADISLSTIGVDGVSKQGREKVLNLDITYNRGDLLSIVGVAREAAALYNLKFRGEEKPFYPSKDTEVLKIKSDPKLSSLYTLTRISDLSYKTTPKDIKKRLELSGMRPINLWADLTNYVMLEWGQPFHAFDAEKVARRDPSLSIQVRSAKKGEAIKTLDGLNHMLLSGDMIIADKRGPIAIAGVMGGKDTEVDEGTTEILLEAAIFDPIQIRKTARRLGLRSEASGRFEHYISPENLLISLYKITQMYKFHGRGEVTGFGSVGETKTDREPVVLTQDKLDQVSGEHFGIDKARRFLKQLGFKVMSSEKGLLCWAPYWRGDISIPEDLVEEVLRLYGYENIAAQSLQTEVNMSSGGRLENWRDTVTRLLASNGFNEVKTYSFVSTQSLTHLDAGKLQRIRNPISAETEYLRPSLVLSLMEVAQLNSPKFKKGKVFELEKIYPKTGEYFSLGAVLWGEKDLFRILKGYVEALFSEANLRVDFDPVKDGQLHPTKSTQITVEGEPIGVLGEIHPHLASSYGVEAAVFEINFEKFVELARDWKPFAPISQYPEVYEDFSFTLAEEYPLMDLVKKIEKLSNLVQNVELLDRYLEKGERSITLRIIFQSQEKSLSAKDIKPLREKIHSIIKKSKGQLRK